MCLILLFVQSVGVSSLWVWVEAKVGAGDDGWGSVVGKVVVGLAHRSWCVGVPRSLPPLPDGR